MPASASAATASATARLVSHYEGLTLQSLPSLVSLYGEDACFKDPFNEVRGRDAIERIFRHMFDTLVAPRFVVLEAIPDASQAFLIWDFHFQRNGKGNAAPLRIHGSSHLRFDPDGRVSHHRDYWDPVEELYAKLPVLGPLARWLQGRLRAPQRQHGGALPPA